MVLQVVHDMDEARPAWSLHVSFRGQLACSAQAAGSSTSGVLSPARPVFHTRQPIVLWMLLVGWIGFNAGSAWSADSIASLAILNTILAAMAGSLTWKIVEVMEKRKPSLIGVLSGLIAGLVATTPAAGLVDP